MANISDSRMQTMQLAGRITTLQSNCSLRESKGGPHKNLIFLTKNVRSHKCDVLMCVSNNSDLNMTKSNTRHSPRRMHGPKVSRDPSTEPQNRQIVSLYEVQEEVPDYMWQRLWWEAISEGGDRRAAGEARRASRVRKNEPHGT